MTDRSAPPDSVGPLPRVLGVLGALLVLGGLTALALRDRSGPGRIAPQSGRETRTSTPPAARERVDGSTAALEREVVAVEAPEPSFDGPLRRLEFRVIDARSSAPVRGALVVFASAAKLDAQAGRRSFTEQPDWDAVERLGPRARTDAGGALFADVPADELFVWAQDGSRTATAIVDAYDDGPVVLPLADASPLRVRTLDASGRPREGVPVHLLSCVHSRFFSSLPTAESIARRTSAGPDAIARFEGAGALLHRSLRSEDLVFDRSFHVTIELPGLRSPSAQLVDLGSLFSDGPTPAPVELFLPASLASLRILVEDEEGRPAPDGTVLTIQTPDVETFYQGFGASIAPRPWTRVTENGTVDLPSVAASAPIEVRIAAEGRAVVPITFTTPAVGTSGEQRLRLPPRLPKVRGRLLEAPGRPAARAHVLWCRTRPETVCPESFREGECRTDAAGKFEVALDPDERTTLWLGRECVGQAAFSGCDAIVSVEGGAGTGDEDLGDVLLETRPVLVEGRCHDERGQGVAGVHVWSVSKAGQIVGSTRSDVAGNFTLRGDPERFVGEIQAEAEHHSSWVDGAWQPKLRRSVVAGERVELALRSHGVLCGPFDPGPGSLDSLRVELPSRAYRFEITGRGYRLEGPAGEIELRLGIDELVPRSFGIASAGVRWNRRTLTVPERCRSDGPTLSLRELVPWIHAFEVRGADGSLLPHATVTDEQGTVVSGDEFGHVLLARDVAPALVTVSGPGHRSKECVPIGERSLVQLAAGIALRIDCVGGPVFSLQALDPLGRPDGEPRRLAESSFGLAAPGPGPLVLQVVVPGDQGLPCAHRVTIEVREQAGEQRIELDVGALGDSDGEG